ncbi:hypothetical protein HDV01_004701 [Terramyces sp. JEL0728]|nr:hypothetical protein HDV01_004701 [Terramyces sp. JEL0728]
MYPQQREYQQPAARPDSAYYYQDGGYNRPSESRASQYYQPPQPQYYNPPQPNFQYQPSNVQSSRPNSSMDNGRVFDYRQPIQSRPASRPNYPPPEGEDRGYSRRSSIVNENRFQPTYTEERRTSIPPPENRYSQPITYPPQDGRASSASIDNRYQSTTNYQPQAFKQTAAGYANSQASNRSFYPERMDNYNNRHRRQPSFESLRSNVFNSPAIRLQHPPRYPNESEVGSVRAGSRVGYDENLENRSISSKVDGQNEQNYENGSNYSEARKSVYKSKSALALSTGQSFIRRSQDGSLDQKPLPGVMRQHSKKMEALLNSTSRLGLNDDSSNDLTKPPSPVISRPAESPSARRFSSAKPIDFINSQHFRKIKSIASEVHSIFAKGQHLYQEDLEIIKNKVDMQIKCIESLERLSNESP